MKSTLAAIAVAFAAAHATAAAAEDPKVAIGISGWTGFGPLDARQGGRNLQEERRRRHPQEDPAEGPPPRHRLGRHPVRGDDRRDLDRVERQRRADTQSSSSTSRTAPTASRCGRTSRRSRTSRARPSASTPPGRRRISRSRGSCKKNGLSMKDVTVATMSPQAAAEAFVAGQNDAAMTYEPYLSAVRDKPEAARSSRPRSTTRW